MTIEAVIAKLSYIMGKRIRGKDIEKMMLTDMRGELSIERSISGQLSKEMKLSKYMDNFRDKFDSHDLENLNDIAQILQPMVIQTCALEGNLEQMKRFIDDGIDVNEKGKDGKTALHIAVAQNDIAMVEFLIEQQNINLHVIDNEGNSALYYA